jgi:hypothetical protein
VGIKKRTIGSLVPVGESRTKRVRVRINFRDGRTVLIDGGTSPIHGDWLWDLLRIPEDERKDLIVLDVSAEAIGEEPPRS